MSVPRIAELRFKPKHLSPWAALRVGMTRAEACEALGPGPSRELLERVRRGQIVFVPALRASGREVTDRKEPPEAKATRPGRKSVRYVNRDPASLRPCLCCRQPFESAGPGNRLCDGCRGRNVSPYAL